MNTQNIDHEVNPYIWNKLSSVELNIHLSHPINKKNAFHWKTPEGCNR